MSSHASSVPLTCFAAWKDQYPNAQGVSSPVEESSRPTQGLPHTCICCRLYVFTCLFGLVPSLDRYTAWKEKYPNAQEVLSPVEESSRPMEGPPLPYLLNIMDSVPKDPEHEYAFQVGGCCGGARGS